MSTKALEQLYPSMSADEINKVRSSEEQMIEYIPVPNSPFTIARKDKEYHILMGKWKMNEEAFKTQYEAEIYLNNNQWNMMMKVASCVCYDMVTPYIKMQASKEAGVKINEPI